MNDFDESELSAEDLEILRAFDAMSDWETERAERTTTTELTNEVASSNSSSNAKRREEHETMTTAALSDEELVEDVLRLFITEVQEDIARMRHTLGQLEQDDQIQPGRFVPLRRAAHKIRGTAGAVECHDMATIAHYAEEIVDQITGGTIFPLIGVNALIHIVLALEVTLEHIIRQGKESAQALEGLEVELQNLGIEIQPEEEQDADEEAGSGEDVEAPKATETEQVTAPLMFVPDSAALHVPLLRVDVRRVEQLTLHSERIAEQQSTLEHAQEQVASALQELHAAQTRLQQLEPALSSMLLVMKPVHAVPELPTSSLVARIMHEAAQRNGSHPPRQQSLSAFKARSRSRLVKTASSATWDELDMERYNERDLLTRSLREAIADVNMASTKVRTSIAHMNRIIQEGLSQVASVRNDILLLRRTPLSTLVPRLRQETAASAPGQAVQFEVEGDFTEVDQEILEALASPLAQLIRTCIADTAQGSPENKEPYRVWLHARGIGNEIVLEIGFSMTVQGGAVEALREPIQRLNGAISLQRNAANGVSFLLRLPRSHNTSHCLVARVGRERIMVPFSQVLRISDVQREQVDVVYQLHELLDFPPDGASHTHVRPVLITPRGISRKLIGVMVDEIVGEVELVVKPLTPYLQRPGISGAAVDGDGHVLLMVDLPELISQHLLFLRTSGTRNTLPLAEETEQQARQPRILVADDSVYFRHSLLQMLQHANYSVTEARDGLEALEQLSENMPDVFLLDVEMPNLNGYDVLNIMHLYPEQAAVKVIMLTSRSSEKHKQHARELGAHAYLTKPCPQETLLATIQEMLEHS
jgi:chemosensory pili system protein ChpA (sensor histidine kinase/response regulator)